MSYVNFGDNTVFEVRKTDGVPQIIMSSGSISVSTCTDDNTTSAQLRELAKELISLADEFDEPDNNVRIYTLGDIHLNKFISKMDEYGNIELGDTPKLMTLEEASRYKNYYQLGIVINIFSRQIGDIKYKTGIINRGTEMYSDVHKDVIFKNNLSSKIIHKLENYGGDDWSWVLQSSQIPMRFNVSW